MQCNPFQILDVDVDFKLVLFLTLPSFPLGLFPEIAQPARPYQWAGSISLLTITANGEVPGYGFPTTCQAGMYSHHSVRAISALILDSAL